MSWCCEGVLGRGAKAGPPVAAKGNLAAATVAMNVVLVSAETMHLERRVAVATATSTFLKRIITCGVTRVKNIEFNSWEVADLCRPAWLHVGVVGLERALALLLTKPRQYVQDRFYKRSWRGAILR